MANAIIGADGVWVVAIDTDVSGDFKISANVEIIRNF
jgi:hypothetical protein